MEDPTLALRLRCLPRTRVLGQPYPVAGGLRARLLGLALLDREHAGRGLLIPNCSSVHTFGMRFPLDLVFLDRDGGAIVIRRRVGRRNFVSCRGADAVLEIPSRNGGGD